MHARRFTGLLVAGSFVAISASCSQGGTSSGSAETQPPNVVVVASFDFPESRLLAEIYAQTIEAYGAHVQRRFDLGPREFVMPALERGLVDVVPEYAGSALDFVTVGGTAATPDTASTVTALSDAMRPLGVTVLAPSPAQDRNAVAVTVATASRLRLRTVSDLAPIASDLTFGGPPECPQRELCLLGLTDTYGIRFRSFVPLDASGPITAAALRSGNVDAAMMFSSSGEVAANGFVLLRDDRGLQPAENVVPLVRTDVLARWPGLEQAIDAVSSELTTQQLSALNGSVALGQRSIADVAATWLRSHGLRSQG